jgi:hypothetical protein
MAGAATRVPSSRASLVRTFIIFSQVEKQAEKQFAKLQKA